MSIRRATPLDVDDIHALVCELAEFEKLRDTVVSTPTDFTTALFGERPLMEAIVSDAPANSEDRLAGMALFYSTFSSFTGKVGLWLEDIYVRPAYRNQGLGTAFIEQFLALARKRDCARAEWSVLDWNKNAIQLYEKLGATILPEWRIARLELGQRLGS